MGYGYIFKPIKLKLGVYTLFECEFKSLESKPPNSLPGGTPPPPPGGVGLYFGDSWVVATFLKLLSSNLVCKLHLGTNFNF